MKKAAAQRHVRHTDATTKRPPHDGSSKPKLRIGRELADTTWRMTVPVVLCAGLGIVADRQLGSGPWITLVGMLLGFGIAILLVKRQIDRWPADVRPGRYKNYYKDEDDDKDYYSD